MQGSSLGPYELLEPLGRGGMGEVYRARRRHSGELVALKTVQVPKEGQLQGIRREIAALARLRHPGVVKILEHGVEQGLPWYAMELLHGKSLRQLIAGGATEPADQESLDSPTTAAWWTATLAASDSEPRASTRGRTAATEPRPELNTETLFRRLRLVRRLCGSLAFLHGEGLVHRDLKPENVLILDDERPVLVDFGLASPFRGHVSRESLEVALEAHGTVAYIAPEQARGEAVDARADLYALGCILYELLVGRPPFVGQDRHKVLWQHWEVEPKAPSALVEGVPGELDKLVLQLLAKEPRQRLGYAADVAAALERLGADGSLEPEGPEPRSYVYRPGFHGRQRELWELERKLEELSRGEPGALVLVAGESGAGKTRLALELCAKAKELGIEVLLGESRAEAGEPSGRTSSGAGALHPLSGPLRRIADRCRERGQQETERLLGQRGPVLAVYEPSLRGLPGQELYGPPAALPPEAARFRLYRFLAETFEALAEEKPLLLVLDDLQWADELTVGFVHLLCRTGRLEKAPCLMLGTYRSEEASEALEALVAQPGLWKLELGRLEEASVGTMVADMLALTLPPELLGGHLTRHSEGNPFFVAEYVQAAVEEGLLFRDAQGRWQVGEPGEERASEAAYEALGLPRSLLELVERRLAGLSEPARQLAEAASVLGREVALVVLGRMTRREEEELWDALRELERRAILLPVREESLGAPTVVGLEAASVRFAHDKLREVAYGRLGAARRRKLHRAAAETLEARFGPRAEHQAVLGQHWERAGSPEKARPCHLAAARAAAQRYAHAEAERLYRAYLGLVEEPTLESIAARHELGADVLGVQGKMDEALAEHSRALEEARRIGDRGSEAESLRWLGQLALTQGKVQPARELFDEALVIARELGDRRLEGLVIVALADCDDHQGRMREGLELYEQSLAILRDVGDRRLEGLALGKLAVSYKVLGRIEEAQKLYEQVLVIHKETGNRLFEGKVLHAMAISYHEQGRIEKARDLFEQALAIHREVGNRGSEGYALSSLGTSFHNQGQFEEARELFEQALAIHREVGDRRFEGLTLGNLANAYQSQGRIEEALELYEQTLAIHREIGNRYYEGFTLGNLADLLRMTTHDLDRVEMLAQDGEAMLADVGDRMELGRVLCIRGHIELSRGRSAGELLDRAEGLAQEMNLGSGGDLGQELAKLRRAQEAFEAGRPLFRGELLEDIPEGLRRWLEASGKLQAR